MYYTQKYCNTMIYKNATMISKYFFALHNNKVFFSVVVFHYNENIYVCVIVIKINSQYQINIHKIIFLSMSICYFFLMIL